MLGFNQPISSNISKDGKDSFNNKKMGDKKVLRSLKVMYPFKYFLEILVVEFLNFGYDFWGVGEMFEGDYADTGARKSVWNLVGEDF